MASTYPDPLLGRSYRYLVVVDLLFLFLCFPSQMKSLSFEFANFDQNSVTLQGDASVSDSQIQLNSIAQLSYGRALYPKAIQLWEWDDTATQKRVTDFTTNFTFSITNLGDGFTFLLVPENTSIPNEPFGMCPGLFSNIPGNTVCVLNKTVVAIEFDTFKTSWDPPFGDHIGADVNSIKSATCVNVSVGLKSKIARAFVTYHSTTKNLSVVVGSNGGSVPFTVSLSDTIDLSTVLPKTVQVGFSSSTGERGNGLHKILDWSFSSNMEETVAPSPTPTRQLGETVALRTAQSPPSSPSPTRQKVEPIAQRPAPSPPSSPSPSPTPTQQHGGTAAPSPTPTQQQGGTQGKRSKSKGRSVSVIGIGVGIFLIILLFGISIFWFILRRKRPTEGSIEADQFDIDEDFEEGIGPKRFAYSELSVATNNFSLEGKLGEGGFGGVYKGILTGLRSREIAVKKIKSGSKQGKKEYISEVKIISRLRHRNLVQLLGWCHDNGELLLVYEFMPNGSLDAHLFRQKSVLLSWPRRYRIAVGLASAVLYLHEEWEQSVIHRDIKSSNVMLDFNFNPKLGDFGLARLADHDVGLQTTAPAGTPGYLSPECLLTGKASKESDVYSFGIVALELTCGRKVIEVKEEDGKVNLVQWVWDLYGKGLITEAVDNGLEGKYDEEQAKCLMVVGLWCSHPDVSYRPSIKQAIAALNYEIPLPRLPPQLPVPIYVAPGMNTFLFSSYTSSNTIEGNYPLTSCSNIDTCTTSSSRQSEKGTYPLL